MFRSKMAAAPAVIVLLSLLLLSWSCRAENTPAILLQVVDAIEKLFGFYKASYQHMNVDGIWGLKVVEGQIQALLEEHQQGQHAGLSPDVVSRLSTVMKESHWVADQAFAAVGQSDQRYFQDLAFIVAQPWTLIKQHRKITPSLRWEIPVYKSAANFGISEAESDRCMQELRRPNTTKMEGGERPSQCRLSDHCGLTMTRRGLTEYSITHQVLWTAIAEKTGCHAEMSALLRKLEFRSIDGMQEEFCTNIYYEMLAVVHVYMAGAVKTEYQDIFMEQQFICPSLGFYEFLKKKYLDQILSWQRPSGCFGDDSDDESSPQGQYPQDRPPGAAVQLETSEQLQGMPEVDRMDEQQQQLGEQLTDLHSDKEAGRRVWSQPGRQAAPGEGFPRQGHRMGVKRSAGTGTENRADLAKARNAVVNNPGSAPKTAVRAGTAVVNSLAGKQSPLSFHHPSEVDQKLQPAAASGRRKEASNQRVELAHKDVMNRPRGQYSDAPNHRNAPPVKRQDDNVHQMKIPSRRDQIRRQELAQNSDSKIRDVGGVVKTEGRPPDSGGPEVGAGVPGERQQRQDHRLLKPAHVPGHRNRRLLVEREMPGRCLSHKTGVAAGALVMYLRYLVDPGPLDLFSPHDFFPDAARSLMGSEGLNKDIAGFLGDQKENFAGGKDRRARLERGADDREEEEEEEEEDEDNDDEDEEYDDKELYPDAKEGLGEQQERRVVHFGANDLHHKRQDDDYVDTREDDKDEYTDEEEEGDYIKRVKGDDKGADNPVDKDGVDEDTEYTYYDDDDDADRGIIKRHKPQAPPQKGARIRTHNRHKPHPPSIDRVPTGLSDSPPTKTVVVLLSVTSMLVLVFMYRCIRKRRINFRPNSRGFFRL